MKFDLVLCWGWRQEEKQWLHLYADARGEPPRIAAVLFVDGLTYFCDMAPKSEILQNFRRRSDNQIMGLELLSIALGLSSFEPWLRGRRVMIWSDNTGAESAAKRGSARCVVHLP